MNKGLSLPLADLQHPMESAFEITAVFVDILLTYSEHDSPYNHHQRLIIINIFIFICLFIEFCFLSY
jgi:hypothetical protein